MMNKQEAIEKIEKGKSNFNAWEDLVRNRAFEDALTIVRKIDEPEKPVVPQYVADFYESIKDGIENNIYDLCVQFNFDASKLNSDVAEWFDQTKNKPIETLVMMHKFGYEVEKEKLYEVFLKRNGAQLGVCIPGGEDKTQFTAEELKEFELDSLDAYEVKEVEDE